MIVFDSSALLGYLLDENGADAVRAAMSEPSACSAANWSEVCQKVLAAGRDWSAAAQLLAGRGVQVVPVTRADAVRAARIWATAPYLSLGDRLCLATAERLDAVAWTADLAWGESDRVRQIRSR